MDGCQPAMVTGNSTFMTAKEQRVVIVTQARMTSTRLPGKVAIDVLGKTLLEHHLERLQRSKRKTLVVVATTTNHADDVIARICEITGTSIFRGSEHDVLERYYFAAAKFDADIVVRVTSDCPLIDPAVIDLTIEAFLSARPTKDYVSNCRLKQTYPRGLDTEVFSFAALKEAHEQATQAFEREHVTPFLWQHPERFALANVDHEVDYSAHRWTVDTPEDLRLVKMMLAALYPLDPEFHLQDCIALLQQNPEWADINKHIEQKKL
jgi:spore coat polysaccharide biosynthesis protein SpsF